MHFVYFLYPLKKVYNVQLVCNQFTTFFIDIAIICWWGSSFLFGCTLNALYCIYNHVYARQNKLRILQNYCKSDCRHLMKIFLFEDYLRALLKRQGNSQMHMYYAHIMYCVCICVPFGYLFFQYSFMAAYKTLE